MPNLAIDPVHLQMRDVVGIDATVVADFMECEQDFRQIQMSVVQQSLLKGSRSGQTAPDIAEMH
ncbi:hypothetical protein D3C75_1118780 [compost metagenome]